MAFSDNLYHPKDGTAINLNDNKLNHYQRGMHQAMNRQ
jgi:hypothetical protein